MTESSRGPCGAALVRLRLVGAHTLDRRPGRQSIAATTRPKRRPKRRSARLLEPAAISGFGWALATPASIPEPDDAEGAGWHGDEGDHFVHIHRGPHRYRAKPGRAWLGPAASSAGVDGANTSTRGGGGGAQGAGAGTAASACTMGALGLATTRGQTDVHRRCACTTHIGAVTVSTGVVQRRGDHHGRHVQWHGDHHGFLVQRRACQIDGWRSCGDGGDGIHRLHSGDE